MREAGPPLRTRRFDHAAKVADAVLYEGYVLYPYRASALKNRYRWQFGCIVPRAYSEAPGGEPHSMQCNCLIEAGPRATVTIALRFLHVQNRTIEAPSAGEGTPWRGVERLDVNNTELMPWEEGVVREFTEDGLVVADLFGGRTFEYEIPPGRDVEVVCDSTGLPRARIVREREALRFSAHVTSERCHGLVKLTVGLENTTPCVPNVQMQRTVALRSSLVSCHVLLAVDDGAFVSLIDPPTHAAAAAQSCTNKTLWPVLVGDSTSRDVMLAAPMILYDYPAVAPESGGDFCDATEIDELLTLRVLTMTDAEKSEAAATDERARSIVDRVDQSAARDIERLHGRTQPSNARADQARWEELLNPPNEPSPEEASFALGSVLLRRGSRVILTPRQRADSMDRFLAGRIATVAAVHRDLEDRTFIAVTLDDDPAADLHRAFGRYFHFLPEEVEPIAAGREGHA